MTISRRPTLTRFLATIGLAALMTLQEQKANAAPDGNSDEMEKELSAVAKEVSDFLKRYGKNTIAMGQFTSPPQLNASAGPSIARTLGEELKGYGIEVKRLADLGLKGEYRLIVKDGPAGAEASIEGEIENLAGKQLFSFTRKVKGTAALSALFGLTVDLPASEGEEARRAKLVTSIMAPQTKLKDSRISAGENSPYAVEVLVKSGDSYLPRVPADEERSAYVKIDRDEAYAVKVVNDSDQDAAVTLTIDGINMFAFSESKDYRFFIVPKRSQAVIKGWHITNEKSDSFLVTDYSKSAVAKLLPSSSEVGTITATFAAAWPRGEKVPADERLSLLALRGKDATGRGPTIDAKYTVVERTTGSIRSSVSVRYTRPK